MGYFVVGVSTGSSLAEVPLPNMQGSSDVHLVEEGWEVFFIRQTSTIPPS
jgi:hypothetical protein